MITRFRCTGEAVEFSSKLAEDFLNVRSLLGFPIVLEKYGRMPISYLMKYCFRVSRNNHILVPE